MKHRGTVLSLIAVALLFAVAASAQTYTELYTYPIGSGAYSGIDRAPSDVAGPRRQPLQHHTKRWNQERRHRVQDDHGGYA